MVFQGFWLLRAWPERALNVSKSSPKRLPNLPRFILLVQCRFGAGFFDLGVQLGLRKTSKKAFWEHLSRPRGDSRVNRFFLPRGRQEAPKKTQEATKNPPRRPKMPPRCPQETPKPQNPLRKFLKYLFETE